MMIPTPALWRCMAVVEVCDQVKGLDDLIREESLNYRWEVAANSPKGFVWYELHVDSGGSEHRAARTAWAILWSLKRLSEEGGLPDFRIVSGGEWLNIPPSELQQPDEGARLSST